MVVKFRRDCFTYLSFVKYRRSAPQKVRPKPMKARMLDVET